ncbi:MAG: HAMP domain-containing sensor histidine kinase [Terriglobia bacterium]|jgi:signal transduction histidine kinase
MRDLIKIRAWYSGISRKGRLRTKFLLSLLVVSAFLTCSTLLVVRHRLQIQIREEIRQDLRNSVVTFQIFQRQREMALEGSAALVANLPIIEALMTSRDPATIQDASAALWRRTGGDLFVLADRKGQLMALHAVNPSITPAQAREMLERSLRSGEASDWWFGGGHLFRVFMRPIYFGEPANGTELGLLVLGSEINEQVAEDVRQVASSQVAFLYGRTIVVSTLSGSQKDDLSKLALGPGTSTAPAQATTSRLDVNPVDVELGQEQFLAMSTDLPPSSSLPAGLVVLRSYDQAARFLKSLNRWLFGLGLTAILAGSLLVFLISDTFTRPLANLVRGVRALEQGNFDYPLEAQGKDEVAELTQSFVTMRRTLWSAQQELLRAERLATVGRMASSISHDLRHSLTTILAYAEFLSEGGLTQVRRLEYYSEIRQAVNQMTDQLRALLEFSRVRMANRPVRGSIVPVIERALHSVKARPAFSGIKIVTSFEGGSEGWFDPASLERVFHNLLLNACEAAPPQSGRVQVTTRETASGLEIRVADNGSGIPSEVRDTLFQPFVTAGKDNGIGLGLATVYKIVQEHQGRVEVERTSPEGTVLRIVLPAVPAEARIASSNIL